MPTFIHTLAMGTLSSLVVSGCLLAASPATMCAQVEQPSAPSSLSLSDERREDGKIRTTLLLLISGLLLVQTLLIVGLLRNRQRYKKIRAELKRSQKALEQRVIDRTNKLRSINHQLYEEIAKHEITEELLRETQDYLNSIINSMPSTLIGVTRQGYITHWNTAAYQATQTLAKEALGKQLNDVYPELNIDMSIIHEAIDQGVPQVNENIQSTHQQDSGAQQTRYLDLTVYPLLSSEITGAVVRIDDVTLRVQLENMMIQNEKMMSLGELAAGMAHEINNPLSAILHGVQNIYRRTSPDLSANHSSAQHNNISVAQVRQYLQDRGIFNFLDGIREAGERSAKIVTNMLEFSRSSSRRHALVNIVALLENSLELSANMFDLKVPEHLKELQLRKEFANNIALLPCSAVEIQQVILNLLRNACQAFSSKHFSADPTIIVRAKQSDNQVIIEIEDNGPGMTETVRRHIFEPFFTTKDVGQGTGLGLSVSYFIITEHHCGSVEVESSPGKGSRFILKLPLSAKKLMLKPSELSLAEEGL